MSEEIFGAVQKLPVNGTKKQVVLQCAPLLTGIKLSNLLNVRADQKEGSAQDSLKDHRSAAECSTNSAADCPILLYIVRECSAAYLERGGCKTADGVLRV
ncbi:MAG: hypothetical protein ACLUAR_15050 [Pilosibacter sp.]